MPVSPRIERAVSRGTPGGTGAGADAVPGRARAQSCQPNMPVTSWPGLKRVVARLDDHPAGDGAHHLADADRRQVGVGRHPAALGRVAGEEEVAHQHLAVGGRGNGPLDQAEVLRLDQAVRAASQRPLTIDAVGHGGASPRGGGQCTSCTAGGRGADAGLAQLRWSRTSRPREPRGT